MFRWLLLLIVVNGLVPQVHEAAERLTRYLHGSGINGVAAGEQDPCGNEHDCSPVAHHCSCCASQSVAPARIATLELPVLETTSVLPESTASPRDGISSRLLRPPVLS